MSKITIEQIKRDLETAAYIERLLPPVKPPKYQCWLFEIVYTPQELAFMDTTPLKIKPTKEQIDLWERVVLDWLEVLEPYERRLLWKRAKHIPWKFLLEEFDCGRSELWRKYSTALVKLFFYLKGKSMLGTKKSMLGTK
ncbi:MAG: hypothetical protein IJ099_07155 [Alphaproteobacteria bacterium]|nr:hypothetical protein [Alphaproteobacteria bacterium]